MSIIDVKQPRKSRNADYDLLNIFKKFEFSNATTFFDKEKKTLLQTFSDFSQKFQFANVSHIFTPTSHTENEDVMPNNVTYVLV